MKHSGSYYLSVMMIMTNDGNSVGLFSIVQAKVTVLESETKKTREPDNTINQSINQSINLY